MSESKSKPGQPLGIVVAIVILGFMSIFEGFLALIGFFAVILKPVLLPFIVLAMGTACLKLVASYGLATKQIWGLKFAKKSLIAVLCIEIIVSFVGILIPDINKYSTPGSWMTSIVLWAVLSCILIYLLRLPEPVPETL